MDGRSDLVKKETLLRFIAVRCLFASPTLLLRWKATATSRDSRAYGGRGVSDALRTRAPQLAWLAARLCATPALRDIDDIEIY